jgi:hypothetical protein
VSDNLILATVIGGAAFLYLLLGAVFARILGIEDTMFLLAVVFFWPVVLVFLVVLALISVRIVGATSNAIRGRR